MCVRPICQGPRILTQQQQQAQKQLQSRCIQAAAAAAPGPGGGRPHPPLQPGLRHVPVRARSQQVVLEVALVVGERAQQRAGGAVQRVLEVHLRQRRHCRGAGKPSRAHYLMSGTGGEGCCGLRAPSLQAQCTVLLLVDIKYALHCFEIGCACRVHMSLRGAGRPIGAARSAPSREDPARPDPNQRPPPTGSGTTAMCAPSTRSCSSTPRGEEEMGNVASAPLWLPSPTSIFTPGGAGP